MTDPIVACVDQSPWADHVTDYAAWAAVRAGVPLELLHVLERDAFAGRVEERSGALGLDAQEALLTTLVDNDEQRSREARERGRVFLHRLRERAIRGGATDVDVRQRHGALRETLVERDATAGLFVLGRRGESAEATRRDLGRNVERVVRSLKTPILVVTDTFRLPQKIMIAFDGGAVTRRGVELLARSPLLRGLPMHLLMCGDDSRPRRQQLEEAAAALVATGSPTTTTLTPGDPERVIGAAIGEQDSDLLVMGAWGHSPLRSLFVGSRTSELVRASRIPVLMLR